MAPLSTASRVLARSAVRAAQQTSSAAAPVNTTARLAAVASSSFCTSVARPDGSAATFKSPFRGSSKSETAPDFSHYLSKKSGTTNALFGYFMVGTLGALSAAGAKSTIQGRFHFSGRGRRWNAEVEMGWTDGMAWHDLVRMQHSCVMYGRVGTKKDREEEEEEEREREREREEKNRRRRRIKDKSIDFPPFQKHG